MWAIYIPENYTFGKRCFAIVKGLELEIALCDAEIARCKAIIDRYGASKEGTKSCDKAIQAAVDAKRLIRSRDRFRETEALLRESVGEALSKWYAPKEAEILMKYIFQTTDVKAIAKAVGVQEPFVVATVFDLKQRLKPNGLDLTFVR